MSRRKAIYMEPKELKLGPNQPSPDVLEEADRIAVLKLTVEKYIPDFALAVRGLDSGTPLLIQQDAFAAAYDDDEYVILGMAIKYAGLHGVTVQIVGKSGETF